MKQVVHILACLLVALGLQPFGDAWGQGGPVLDGANAFITRWKGEAGKPIQVPLYGNYAYSWEKADGTVIKADVADVANEGVLELPVSKAGEYVLKAGPAGVKRIEYGINEVTYYLGRRGTPKSLLQVVQWGSVAWESFAGAFYGCEKMNIAEGAGRPDLSRVINMQSAFWDCLSFNSPIGNWDVSKVTNMAFMFVGCSSFNQPLGKWDVSNVTDMSRMFKDCRAFNQPLGQWNVSKVTNMFAMFSRCSSFNQPLGKWDVSKVTDMSWMFKNCSAFNQPLEKWDVSKVTNMAYMFLDCSSFNQPLGNWDVSKVINMYAMFSGCSSFDQPLGQWTLSGLARDQSESHDLIVSSGLSVENYSATLAGWAAKKDQLTTGIRVKANARYFDESGKAARQELIEAKEWEFLGDEQWLPIEPLDSVHAFVTRWQGKAGDTISVPLYGQYSYEWLGADGRVVSSGEARVVKAGVLDLRVPADGEYVLRAGPAGVTQIEFGKYRWGLYLSSRGTPNALKEVSQWGGVKWESFAGAFYECTNMNIAEGAGKPDLSRVTNMQSAFWDCLSLNSPIGNWDVSNVTDMSGMFAGCGLFNQPLGGWVFSAPEHHDRMNRLGLSNSGMSVHNYSSTLVEWAAKINRMPRRWHVDAKGLKYNAAAKAARKKLVEERQWEFSEDEEATW